MPNSEGIFAWELRSPKTKKLIKYTPSGRLIVNNHFLAKKACLSHEPAGGEIVEILKNQVVSCDSYHLYYPNRRQNSPLFKALIECLSA
ncbi:hypothetical protein HMPREF3179_10825 [Oligella sp. HMSC09E12]|nr:hypothetical protein HMPREF3179_10825 [Oligella sp. HMSC09E12]